MTSQKIEFYFRGRVVGVDGLSPTTTVLQWLRGQLGASGTKEGCAEGDCGACTVVVGELGRTDDLVLRPINACIRFLPTLHGKALFTVEDLGELAGGNLHPVQQAMVDCHGSQCGFCTPGFVMSLFATYSRHGAAGTRPSRQMIADDLAGNLCRCTGYRPILDAAERMFTLPAVTLLGAPVAVALREIADRTTDPFIYEARNPAFADRPGPQTDRFYAPRTIEQFAALREADPRLLLLAGATDIGLWVNKQFRDVGDLLFIGEVGALDRIERHGGVLRIGAAARLQDAWLALAELIPELAEMALRFAGPPVRHAGTMGGNIANGSPIGDSAPALMALDASVALRLGARSRLVRLDAFYLDYMKNALQPGEFIEAIEVPVPGRTTLIRAYKVSKRQDSDISALSCGCAVTIENGIVKDVRLVFGGMAAVVKRAAGAEAALRDDMWGEAAVRAAMAALAEDFTPLGDLRASAGYRMRVARNLIWRFWLETRPEAPLAARQVRARVYDAARSVAGALP